MLRLAVATLRARWLSLAGSVVALVAGVALVTAAGATINAAAAGPGGRTLRYSAADVVTTTWLGLRTRPIEAAAVRE